MSELRNLQAALKAINANKLCYTLAALNEEHFLGNGFDRSKLQAR
jgi:hypothetical protein